jgi:hypothetical protein
MWSDPSGRDTLAVAAVLLWASAVYLVAAWIRDGWHWRRHRRDDHPDDDDGADE